MSNKVVQLSSVKKTESKSELNIQVMPWRQALPAIRKVKPELADIIEQWNPGDDYELVKASYPFGAQILRDGVFHLPRHNTPKTLPINQATTPEFIRNLLSYSPVPLGIITTNGCEVYLEDHEQISTLAFFKPGIILGLWESLDPSTSYFPTRIWDAKAGARSLFMLPSISDANSHRKLKQQYNLRLYPPKTLRDHCRVFQEIANSNNFSQEWSFEILFFTKRWLEPLNNLNWTAFHHYLLKDAWELSAYPRNHMTHNVVWQQYQILLRERGVKPHAYALDTLKYIIGVAVGALPGFSADITDESVGPIQGLQAAYLNTYGIDYVPTIMQPKTLNNEKNTDHVYCSLQLPSIFLTKDGYKRNSTLLSDLKEIKELWECFIDFAIDGKLKIENTYFQTIVDNIAIDFYHTDAGKCDDIRSAHELADEDPALIKHPDNKAELKFAENSSFMRGCIKISKISTDYTPDFN